ncbi:MAG TPA: hypothetical protein VM535_00010 [Candidatus Saccharimonadales bacterium]|nr:hypothetical protein [Candidatus Saccharimonadales bacterium]
MKLTNEYVIIARDASIDSSDQMVSIHKIIDNFTFGYRKEEYEKAIAASGGKPLAFPINYTVTSSWRAASKAASNFPFKIQIKLIDPNGDVLNENVQEAVIEKGKNRIRFNVNVQGFPVSEAGVYHYDLAAIDDRGKELATGKSQVNVELRAEG